jgi:hypothetical protein
MIVKYYHISILFLIVGFVSAAAGVFFSFSYSSYISQIFFLLSLFLYLKLTPLLYIGVFFISFCLFLASPSPFLLAALFPLIGFLFSGGKRFYIKMHKIPRYSLVVLISMIYIYYYFLSYKQGTAKASHNWLSVVVVYAIIAETLYFGFPSKYYFPLICISFFVFGNRSSLFLIAAFLKNKKLLLLFIGAGVLFIVLSNRLIIPPWPLNLLFDRGGILYRSYVEHRVLFLYEFVQNFDILELDQLKHKAMNVPSSGGDFYNFHNSFLTIIVRDGYLGLGKVAIWCLQIFMIPFGIFTAITFRATYDTFLLGGSLDMLLFALIGQNIRCLLKNTKNACLDIQK